MLLRPCSPTAEFLPGGFINEPVAKKTTTYFENKLDGDERKLLFVIWKTFNPNATDLFYNLFVPTGVPGDPATLFWLSNLYFSINLHQIKTKTLVIMFFIIWTQWINLILISWVTVNKMWARVHQFLIFFSAKVESEDKKMDYNL